MSLGLAFLKPLILPVVRLVVGSLVTPAHMRRVIDLVFSSLHKVADRLPTHGVALSAFERSIDKDALAAELAKDVDAIL